jgi:hypothetical protein
MFREGAEINHKKPKSSDYEDAVQALILRAASQYEVPNAAPRVKWAQSLGLVQTVTPTSRMRLQGR